MKKIIRSYYDETLQHMVNVYESTKPSRQSQAPVYSKTFKQNQKPAPPSVSTHMSKTQLRNIRFFKLRNLGQV